MNVLLIQPNSGFQLRGTFYPICRDIMFCATFLSKKGYQVRIIDRCLSNQILPDNFSPEAAIVFIAPSSSVKDAALVSDFLHNNSITVIWADVAAVIISSVADAYKYCDYILNREYCISADLLLRALMNNSDVVEIDGLSYLENNVIVFNNPASLPDLSFYDPIKWSLIDVDKCFRRFQSCSRMLNLCASIGCPYSCGFCFTPICYGARRKLPIENVISEIDYLVDNHHLDGINFSDELLLFTTEELVLLKECREHHNNSFVWGGETRPHVLNPDLLQKMYDAGCRWLLFGLETGSERMRKKINKPYSSDQVRSIVDECSNIGIATFGSFIIGFPGETENDLTNTINFALSLNLDAYLFNYFQFVMGSPLYKEVEKRGDFSIDNIDDFNNCLNIDRMPVNLSEISKKDLATVKAYFDLLTITRKKKAGDNKSAGLQFFRKAINTATEYLHGSPAHIIAGLWNIASRGLSVFWYPIVHPKIRKKYGLYFRKSKRND